MSSISQFLTWLPCLGGRSTLGCPEAEHVQVKPLSPWRAQTLQPVSFPGPPGRRRRWGLLEGTHPDLEDQAHMTHLRNDCVGTGSKAGGGTDHEKNKRLCTFPTASPGREEWGKMQSQGANDFQISLNLKATPLRVTNRTVTSHSDLSICESQSLLHGLVMLLTQLAWGPNVPLSK